MNPNDTFPLCLPANMSADTFINDYWQKKPLLIKNGLPSITGMLEPDDVLDLALYDDVTARLITQTPPDSQQNANGQNMQADDWQLHFSPLTEAQLANTPEKWTLLVQDLEQWSIEIADLWQHFAYIPQWQRDDIMVSYAPKGGSVGQHYDNYDVFLVQGHGHRRWQLGKFCDDKTPILPNQPLRLLTDMGDIIFDEVLATGDVLYVPPGLSHYGVAQDDCLTFSFGCRRPSNMALLGSFMDDLATCDDVQTNFSLPIQDHLSQTQGNTKPWNHAHIDKKTTDFIKQQLIQALQQSTLFDDAIAKCLSTRRFELIDEEEPMETEIVLEQLHQGAFVIKEPAVKLLYTTEPLQLFCQGETVDNLFPAQKALLRRLADGECLQLADFEGFDIDALCDWINNGWITLVE